MLSTDPHPVQIACMDDDTVVHLVRFLSQRLEKMLRTKDLTEISRVGAWVWAILGKCRDQGELASEEISELRELAQIALRLQRHGHEEGKGEDADIEVESSHNGDVEDNDAAEVAAASDSRKDVTITVEGGLRGRQILSTTLDMVITIVGEVYGQRDLLEHRRKWSADEDEGILK